MGSKRRIEVVQQNNVLGRIKARAVLDESLFGKDLFKVRVAGFREINLMGLFIHPIVPFSLFIGLTL